MRWAGVAFVASVLLSLLSFETRARAEPIVDKLLACSAEFQARAEYANTLGHSDLAYIRFLSNRADALLWLAERVSPREIIGCGSRGPSLDLVLCLGPPMLDRKRNSLVLDRLASFAEAHRGSDRLPVCIEDEPCANCLRILAD